VSEKITDDLAYNFNIHPKKTMVVEYVQGLRLSTEMIATHSKEAITHPAEKAKWPAMPILKPPSETKLANALELEPEIPPPPLVSQPLVLLTLTQPALQFPPLYVPPL
jgi:hypothetical protein